MEWAEINEPAGEAENDWNWNCTTVNNTCK